MSESRLDALRSRVATAIGVSVLLPLVTPSTPVGAQEVEQISLHCEPARDLGHDKLDAPRWDAAAEFCPGIEELQIDVDTYCRISAVGEPVLQKSSCCYPVTLNCPFDGFAVDNCCYGRPYLTDRGPAVAPARSRGDWAEGSRVPDPTGLSDDQRQRLAAHWAAAGLAEHASVAGFASVVLDLVAWGAPMDLVLRAQAAGIDETRHAQGCFELAEAYGGSKVGPGAVPLGQAVPIAASLVDLAVATAREGCVGETIGAHIAAVLRDRATDPTVRRTLAVIADDEAGHAGLAWATLRWAIAEGGSAVAQAVARSFDRPNPRFGDGGPADATMADHGLMADDALAVEIDRVYEQVILPAREALLGGSPHAGPSAEDIAPSA